MIDSTVDSQRVIEWSQWPFRFYLHTDVPEIAERAPEVLRHWRFSSEEQLPVESLRMTVERDVGGYRLTADNGSEPAVYGDSRIALRAVEMTAAVALLEARNYVTSVHAALLRQEERGVLVVGPSESGKSTLSCALWHNGWQLLADDVALVDCSNQTAVPVLRRVSLRHPSRELVGEEFWKRMTQVRSCDKTEEGYVFHPDELTRESRARSTAVSAIVFLARSGAPKLELAQARRIEPAHAMIALAPYTNQLEDADMGKAMRRLAPLMDSVPAYDLARGPLAEMIRVIGELSSAS